MVRCENSSRFNRTKAGMSSSPRNLMDPYMRLSCAVIASAGKEYRAIVARGGVMAPQEVQSIRDELLDPCNPFMRYTGYDPEILLDSLESDLARQP